MARSKMSMASAWLRGTPCPAARRVQFESQRSVIQSGAAAPRWRQGWSWAGARRQGLGAEACSRASPKRRPPLPLTCAQWTRLPATCPPTRPPAHPSGPPTLVHGAHVVEAVVVAQGRPLLKVLHRQGVVPLHLLPSGAGGVSGRSGGSVGVIESISQLGPAASVNWVGHGHRHWQGRDVRSSRVPMPHTHTVALYPIHPSACPQPDPGARSQHGTQPASDPPKSSEYADQSNSTTISTTPSAHNPPGPQRPQSPGPQRAAARTWPWK